jgi:hypothetical protein
MNDSKPRLLLSQENAQQLNDALVQIGADLRERSMAACRQAGEVVAKMAQRGSEWGGGKDE